MERKDLTMGKRRGKKIVSKLQIINWILFVAILGVSALIIYYFMAYRLLQFKHLNTITYIVMLIATQFIFLLNVLKKRFKIVTFISLLYLGLIGYGAYTIQHVISGFTALQQTTKYTEQTMSVVVHNTSDITTIQQLDNQTVYAPTQVDEKNINTIVQDVKEKANVILRVKDVASYTEAYKSLIDGKVNAIILDSVFENLLEQEDPDYLKNIRRIHELVIRTEQKVEEPAPVNISKIDGTLEPFNIYISGIDTFGPINSVSRSDVNIIMSINPRTNKILLTSTPRDSYVRIAGGGKNQYDKLTHAGIYGVQASVDTLKNLYNTSIDYYARINFTSFINLIDLVGGVSVYNDQTFTSRYGGHYFPQGTVYLTSDTALGFVRERYNLANGDVDRAKNQQKVIEAIIKKLASPVMITRAGDIMSQLSQSMQTNMPFEVIMTLVNQQLNSSAEVSVQSQALSVTGQMGLSSYAMPGYNLYMGVVNQSSLSQVSAKMRSLLEE